MGSAVKVLETVAEDIVSENSDGDRVGFKVKNVLVGFEATQHKDSGYEFFWISGRVQKTRGEGIALLAIRILGFCFGMHRKIC